MKVFYNEWDGKTAKWLEELGDRNELPKGEIDTRSIGSVRADDLRDFDQCHFFAGIGGWPLALRWAGLEGTPGIWTGSPPCQPFSVAGKGLGQADDRHLAPVWIDLIRKQKPGLIFGEQVEAAIRVGWLDDLFDALEGCGYACGAAVLPACSVGAPHIRKRLFFGAVKLDAVDRIGRERREGAANRCFAYRTNAGRVKSINAPSCAGETPGGLADADDTRSQGWAGMPERADEKPAGAGSVESGPADPHHGFWAGADWLGCRDGKFRPVEPGTQPLAHGLPARVGRLRGYGNAIVPQVAAQFVMAFMEALGDMRRE